MMSLMKRVTTRVFFILVLRSKISPFDRQTEKCWPDTEGQSDSLISAPAGVRCSGEGGIAQTVAE